MSEPHPDIVILCGGLGTRLGPLTATEPKPLLRVAGVPILFHLMLSCAAQGFESFVLCLGHLGDRIRDTVAQLDEQGAAALGDGDPELVTALDRARQSWQVRLADTGEDTRTGGRLARIAGTLGPGPAIVTYADGLADVDLHALLGVHRSAQGLATLTIVHPPPRFGEVEVDGVRVTRFAEKQAASGTWINGGFMVLEPEVFSLPGSDAVSLEADVLPGLAERDQVAAHRHEGFWQCMDTPAEAELLNRWWEAGRRPWATWAEDRRDGGETC
jgi:glucose-1-phosphate cytidylyltransferase